MTFSMPESSSRTRSDSLDDPDLPEPERKRSRLNSAKPDPDSAGEFIEAALMPQMTPSNSSTPLSRDQQLGTVASVPDATMATSPTSKVTINTRSLVPQNSSQPKGQGASDDTHAAINGDYPGSDQSRPDVADMTLPPTEVKDADPTEIETISISSSASKSPEIQVADVEDFDQDPSETKWAPITRVARRGASEQTLSAHHVYNTFPLAQRVASLGSCHKAAIMIGNSLAKGSDTDADLFRQVKSWLAEFVQRCPRLTKDFVSQEPQFWQSFPELVRSLLRREIELPADLTSDDLEDFLFDFARLGVLMIDLDLSQMQHYTKETSAKEMDELYCQAYLGPLGWIVQYEDIPFYVALTRSRTHNVRSLITRLIDRMCDSTTLDILSTYTNLLHKFGDILPRKPTFVHAFISLVCGALLYLRSLPEREPDETGEGSEQHAQLEYVKQKCLDFFDEVDKILQQAIVKQFQWLTIETSHDILSHLYTAMKFLGEIFPPICFQAVTNAGVNLDGLSNLDSSQAITEYAWKFKTLRKYITHGRMELRVQGVDIMKSDLVGIHKHHIQGKRDFMSSPLVLFLVKFIQENKLINYIVGVDSHPQLISCSGNIVGYLCVTGTYTQEDTDIIWATVAQSEDARTVTAVLDLLKSTFSLLDVGSLNYLCSKLHALPIRRFGVRMLSYTIALLDAIRRPQRPTYPEPDYQDPVALELCIRLLREVTAEPGCSQEQINEIRHVANDQLGQMIQPAWTDPSFRIAKQVQERQWKVFAQDTISNNACATGSIQAMNAWLVCMPSIEAQQVLQELEVPRILVENIVHVSHSLREMAPENLGSSQDLEVRIFALGYVMTKVPDMFTSKLLENLWINLFTAEWIPAFNKSFAWQSLTGLVTNNRLNGNSIIDTIIDKYLPRLMPKDLNKAVLQFVQLTVRYEIKKSKPPVDDEDIATIPGMERVWRIMLEAPPDTVEANATDYMIREYLDNELVTKRSNSCIQATHLSLVDRCVRQAIDSAAHLKSFAEGVTSGEDEPMVIIASQDEIRAEELRFDRSLLFLRKLLEGMKARPRYSPSPIGSPAEQAQNFEKRGEAFALNLQIFGSDQISNHPRQVPVGTSNTGEELWLFLSKLTGFTDFSVIAGGKKIPIKDDKTTLKRLGFGPGRLIVNKTRDTPENGPSEAARCQSPVDSRVMNHFQELYDLLELDERLAREIYSFLTLFPAPATILSFVRSKEASAEELLPVEKPYKLLYCAQALRSCLEVESFSTEPDVDFVRYGIRTIVSTFPRLESSGPNEQLDVFIAQHLLESLLLGLRAKVSQEQSLTYIVDHQSFASHLMRLAANGQQCFVPNTQQLSPQSLVREPLEALLEGCLHDDRVWQALESIESTPGTLMNLILCDHRSEVRKAVADVILGLSGVSGAKLVLKVNDPRSVRSRYSVQIIDYALHRVWAILSSLLSETIRWPFQCQEMFEACIATARRIGKSFTSSAIASLFENWSSMLVSYRHNENIGLKVNDHVVWGFTKLLQECCKLLRQNGNSHTDRTLTEAVVSKFLFPGTLSASVESGKLDIPVLSSNTREDLYDLLLLLSPQATDIANLISLMESYIAQDQFEPFIHHERQALRSEVGYSGLRNLSNTCYLNSLFSQLFMNAEFRDLIIHTNVIDSSKQALVENLGQVFAYMQDSFEKYIDPSAAIEAITVPAFSGQDDHIDVTVQMDVDEFYNILFDQIEQQILDPKSKKDFKSVYGGQIVQQVKSKECEHISERLEPFSNIQIEIKGKQGLEDGLKAYVEGEVLQGDNKYSCTSCERHVDAIKRACLKEVPDNLIFNLKRFDYDIMTGTRTKVNDEFSFPETIDMAPYKVENLSEPGRAMQSDMFELTGVIVHAGTADSGHYYSYIRQRPSSKDARNSWVHFNDVDVAVFDPRNLKDQCFGGIDTASAFHWSKIHSAYMLFYQRTSSIQHFENMYRGQHDDLNPVRIRLPLELEGQLRQQNEQFIRSYCLQDAAHARFIRLLLERIQINEDVHCSDDHEYESKLLRLVLDYIHQVSSRWKEHPEFESTIKLLKRNAISCANCARTIVQWYSDGSIPGDTLLRTPYQLVRRSFGTLILASLAKYGEAAKAPQSQVSAEDFGDLFKEYQLTVQGLVDGCLANEMESLQRWGRSWDHFFEFLMQVMNLGLQEAFIVLDADYLNLALDLVTMHISGSLNKTLRAKYPAYLAFKEKNRLYLYTSLMDFLATILERVDFSNISEGNSRTLSGIAEIGLTSEEGTRLGLTAQSPPSGQRLEWLRRVIIGRHNPVAANRIVCRLVHDRNNLPLLRQVYNLLDLALQEDNIGTSVAFLEPILHFCQQCPNRSMVMNMVKVALESIETIGDRHGKDHLDFVAALIKCENQEAQIAQTDFQREILNLIGTWAPALLIFPVDMHADVPYETVDLLKPLLFNPFGRAAPDTREYQILRRGARSLVKGCSTYARKHYLEADLKEKSQLAAGQASWFLQVVDHCMREALEPAQNAAEEERLADVKEVWEQLKALSEMAQAEADRNGIGLAGMVGEGLSPAESWHAGTDGLDSDAADADGLSVSDLETDEGGGQGVNFHA